MKQLLPFEYPRDFYYHRTSAEIYRPYIESCGNIHTFDIGNYPQYAWKKGLLGDRVHVVKYERTDIEPDIERLKQDGVKHAMVTWIPYSRQDIPEGWKRLWLTDHFQETSVNELTQDYKTKWNDRARRALKKYERSGAEVKYVDSDTFIEAFKKSHVKSWNYKLIKNDYIRNYKRIRAFAPDKVRQWLVYQDGEAVAGLACLDYINNHSVHFVAFTDTASYPIQGGTALIDEWFRSSAEKGIKYITFDQLRNPHGPSDQRGYTEFKENFVEHRLSFPKAYFKIF
ncbi:GNAT family N-acetyltransferase [Candidatus Gracilibacteria bacterium]|nr:GNAT family N-acetyltransferase [Candidatus Gracilibacteria bacterium]